MTSTTTNVHHTAQHSATPRSFWQWLGAVLAVRRQRKSLSDLEPHLLKDIGLTREAAEREAKRKIWDVPEYWLR